MERRLIEEMATMKGGRGRLKKVREQCEEECSALTETIDHINEVLGAVSNGEMEDPVDSLGE